MFLSLSRPTRHDEQVATDAGCAGGFNYPAAHVGLSRGMPPLPPLLADSGYALDHARHRVGTGPADFERARALLERWGCGCVCVAV